MIPSFTPFRAVGRRVFFIPGKWRKPRSLDDGAPTPSVFSEYDLPERKRGARLLMLESGFGAIATSIYGNFAGAFAIHLGATTIQMGLFSAINELLTGLSGLVSPLTVRLLFGRKKSIVITVILSGFPWLLIAFVPVLPEAYRVWVLIPSSALAVSLLLISDPVWGSWMADLVPRYRRGIYLGLRGSMITLVTVVVGLTGAVILDILDDHLLRAFMAIFAAAFLARIISAIVFMLVVDPRPDLHFSTGMTPMARFKSIRTTQLGRFHLFVLMFHIAAGLAAPFMGLYLLRTLGISYLTFVGMGAASNLAVAVTMPIWGKIADTKGNFIPLTLSAVALSVWPMAWLISADVTYLFLIHILVGTVMSGWGLALYKFVIEQAEDESRPSEVGFFRAMASGGMFLGALIGGVAVSFLPAINGTQFLTILLISGVLRLISTAVLLPGIRSQTSPAA